MKKYILILTIASLFLGFMAMPASALSENAERFLLSCRALDAPFPPENWDRWDLRDAALEVLDAIEAGSYKPWPTDFCIKALGHTRFPEDLERILAYEEKMTYSVLRALKGFPHEKAVNTMFKYLNDEKSPKRESAVVGLADIDFRKMKDGAEWKTKILDKLRTARDKEKVDWLIKDMDEAIAKVETAPVLKKPVQ